MATRKDQESKSRSQSKQGKSKPASESPFQKREVEEVAHAVMQRRREALRALAAFDNNAILTAERNSKL